MDSKTDHQKSTLEQFDNYKHLITAEIELLQRILEIRQNFSGSDDLERLVEPIVRRITQIRSEKRLIEKNLFLF
ncbi:hypothetical protein NMSP_1129 [Candidatus Nitrosomarinus catalina]|uniref:Uncharacterized protein n=1 Tax=Candidatus Nitrosomarinus catalinensis TaxID=1898749 RepID=A0A2Z2HLZ8_9ARCH|nr:hypothetical protein [Candidatus Nitrosomarinus catalina]ARS64745.1 hypothetical protein NMSP_1129 [Candidatus Nitrosomarinus catalina]